MGLPAGEILATWRREGMAGRERLHLSPGVPVSVDWDGTAPPSVVLFISLCQALTPSPFMREKEGKKKGNT